MAFLRFCVFWRFLGGFFFAVLGACFGGRFGGVGSVLGGLGSVLCFGGGGYYSGVLGAFLMGRFLGAFFRGAFFGLFWGGVGFFGFLGELGGLSFIIYYVLALFWPFLAVFFGVSFLKKTTKQETKNCFLFCRFFFCVLERLFKPSIIYFLSFFGFLAFSWRFLAFFFFTFYYLFFDVFWAFFFGGFGGVFLGGVFRGLGAFMGGLGGVYAFGGVFFWAVLRECFGGVWGRFGGVMAFF